MGPKARCSRCCTLGTASHRTRAPKGCLTKIRSQRFGARVPSALSNPRGSTSSREDGHLGQSGNMRAIGNGARSDVHLPLPECRMPIARNLSPRSARVGSSAGRQRGGTAMAARQQRQGLRHLPGPTIRRHSRPSSSTAMLASAAGLPRVCALQKCRRRKRCFGPYRRGPALQAPAQGARPGAL